MTIYMANNPFHSKTGRQLWGIFEIGSSIVGIVRFCPAMPEDRKECSLADFEKACVLDDGVCPALWPMEERPNGTSGGEVWIRIPVLQNLLVISRTLR